MVIEQSTFILRPHREDDKKEIVSLGYDSDLFRGIGSTIPNVPIEEYADAWFRLKSDPKYSWAIEVEDRCVGSVWLHSIEEQNRRARFAIEIHDPESRNKGIGKKATKAVVKFAFETLNLHRLDLRVLISNRRAIECYKACGFIEEGIQRDTLFIDNKWDSDLWMSILESEYKTRSNKAQ